MDRNCVVRSLWLMMSFLFVVVLPPAVLALELVTAPTSLPSECPVHGIISAVYTGNDLALIFCENAVIKYELSTDTVLEVAARGVDTTEEAVARAGDGSVYLVARVGISTTEIWHISEVDLVWTQLPVVGTIPDGISFGSALWDGQDHIYIITSSLSPDLYKFSLVDYTLVVSGALPEPRTLTAAARLTVEGQSYAYIFGGAINGGATDSSEILLYDPESEEVSKLSVHLPIATQSLNAAWSKTEAYLICGGRTDTENFNFMRYNPVTNQITVEQVEGFDFTCLRLATIYVPSLNRVYIFGDTWSASENVRYIELNPEPTTTELPEYRFELEFALTKLPLSCNADATFKNSAVYDEDDTVYIFCDSELFRYQLSTDEVSYSGPFVSTSYATTAGVENDRIYAFTYGDPPERTEVWQILTSDLSTPTRVSSTTDEWFGGSTLSFAGGLITVIQGSDPYLIQRFSAVDHTWTNLGSLPEPKSRFGSVLAPEWGGIFMFGDTNTEYSTEILRYDFGSQETSLFGRLPIQAQYRHGVVWTGKYAYLICAGYPDPAYNFMRFGPARNETIVLTVRGFDFDCTGASVIYSQKLGRIYIFGNTWFPWTVDQPIMYIDISHDVEPTTTMMTMPTSDEGSQSSPTASVSTNTGASVSVPVPTTTERPEVGCSALDKYGMLYEAVPGQNATNICPRGSKGTTTWFCMEDNKFRGTNPDYSGCSSPWLEDIKDIIESGVPLTPVTASNLLRDIKQFLQDAYDSDASDLEGNVTYFGHELKFIFRAGQAILDLVDNSAQLATMETLTENAFGIFDHLIMHWSQWEEVSQRDRSDAGTVFMQSSDSAAMGLAQRASAKVENSSSRSYRKTFRTFDEFQILAGAEKISENAARITFPEVFDPKRDSYLEIPCDWAQYFPGQDYVSFSGFSLKYANASALFPAKSPWEGSFKMDPRKSGGLEEIVNGPMIGFTFSGQNLKGSFTGGEEGVRITFQHEVPAWGPERWQIRRRLHDGEAPKAVLGTGVCMYWNEDNLSWSTEGCRLIYSNSDTTVCECSHLTAFAVIFDLHDYIGKDLTLEMMTWVLCSLSIFCLVLTIVVLVYSRFKKRLITKHPRNDLTLNLCISLLLANILIMVTLDKHYLHLSDGACVASAILLHYSLVCAFSWMALEGILLAKLIFIDVFATGREYATFEGCGALIVPGIIVGATFAVNYGRGEHAYGNDAFCWLHGRYLWSFIALVAGVLAFNASVLVMSIRKSYALHKNPNRKVARQAKSAGFWIRGALSLTFIMGLTWSSGFLMLIDNPTVSNVAAYIFTAANASQGIFIFWFHIGSSKQIRSHFKTFTFSGTSGQRVNR